MGLFRRTPESPGPAAGAGIDAFWQWWTAEGRADAERSIEGDLAPQDFASTMAEHLDPVGPLAWELTTGDVSQHVLVVSAEGDPERRALARRVVLAAPEADATWSYVDTRPPAADPEGIVLGSDGELIDFDRVGVSARLHGEQFDVAVHHPAYAQLPAEARERITVLALDAALGESGTELWIGGVTASEVSPVDAFGLSALRAVVHDLERQHVDADGRPRWLMLQGQGPGGPLVAMVRRLLRPSTAPHLDTYVSVALPYRGRDAHGLPDESSAAALEDVQQRLADALGTSGEIVAHLSTGGVRTVHLYADSTAAPVPALKQVAKTWAEGRAAVHEMHDPGWEAVAHLRQ